MRGYGEATQRLTDQCAYINRLEHAINNLDNQLHNTQSAESTIRDVDFANETSQYTRNQILTQSATAMLAQANAQTPLRRHARMAKTVMYAM